MKNIMPIDKELVGKRLFINFNKTMTVEVEVLDIQIFYGKKRYLIAPIAGKGTTWIEKFYKNK